MDQAPANFASSVSGPFKGALKTGASASIAGPPSSALVIAVSLAAHFAGAAALATIPVTHGSVSSGPRNVAVTLTSPPPRVDEAPPPLPEPEPAAIVPVIDRPRREIIPDAPEPHEAPAPEAPAPEVVAPAPVTAAPPSLDDVFGDPPPAPSLLTSSTGVGGHAVASGEGGPAGGRPGGTGSAIGAGSGGTEVAAEDPGARRRARLAYKRELERLLRARSAYPRAALRDRLEGRVELALRIGRDGSVLAVRIAESSGYALLDDAAVDSARADRLPAPPEAAGLRESDELTVGLVYVVR